MDLKSSRRRLASKLRPTATATASFTDLQPAAAPSFAIGASTNSNNELRSATSNEKGMRE
ncbi:putative autophagy-related protein 9A [Sesbania bispinosa]|nr:putative autophagy-related protein 9A [Sesbania bispinosa]